MEQYLETGNGIKLNDSYARESLYGLFVYIQDPEYDMVKALIILMNEKATQNIKYHYFKVDIVFNGYTKLKSVQDDGKRIIAMLVKG